MPFIFMLQLLLELAFFLQHYISKIMRNSEESLADENTHRLAWCPTKMNTIHEQLEKSASSTQTVGPFILYHRLKDQQPFIKFSWNRNTSPKEFEFWIGWISYQLRSFSISSLFSKIFISFYYTVYKALLHILAHVQP